MVSLTSYEMYSNYEADHLGRLRPCIRCSFVWLLRAIYPYSRTIIFFTCNSSSFIYSLYVIANNNHWLCVLPHFHIVMLHNHLCYVILSSI